MILLTGSNRINSFVQFITVLLIFLIVLVITYVVTKWIAKFQKTQTVGSNIEVIETQRITTSKYIQIVKIGERYFAIAVCKDTVTMLSEINKEEISFNHEEQGTTMDFKTIWEKVKTSARTSDKTDQEK